MGDAEGDPVGAPEILGTRLGNSAIYECFNVSMIAEYDSQDIVLRLTRLTSVKGRFCRDRGRHRGRWLKRGMCRRMS